MSTLSVPMPDDLMKGIKNLVSQGKASTMSEIVRRAVARYLEDQAVETVLRAAREPSLSGDIDKLAKKI